MHTFKPVDYIHDARIYIFIVFKKNVKKKVVPFSLKTSNIIYIVHVIQLVMPQKDCRYIITECSLHEYNGCPYTRESNPNG